MSRAYCLRFIGLLLATFVVFVTIEPPVVDEVHQLLAADPKTYTAGAVEQATGHHAERHAHALRLPLVCYCDAQGDRDDGANYCPC